jgi:hypothetical protein
MVQVRTDPQRMATSLAHDVTPLNIIGFNVIVVEQCWNVDLYQVIRALGFRRGRAEKLALLGRYRTVSPPERKPLSR